MFCAKGPEFFNRFLGFVPFAVFTVLIVEFLSWQSGALIDSAIGAHSTMRASFIIECRVTTRIGCNSLLLFDGRTVLRKTKGLDGTVEELDRNRQDESQGKDSSDAEERQIDTELGRSQMNCS